jgi:hypothetical protein
MTTTALRALTAAAFAAAVLLTGTPALADDPGPVPACDESTGEYVLVFDQNGVSRCAPTSEVDKGDDSTSTDCPSGTVFSYELATCTPEQDDMISPAPQQGPAAPPDPGVEPDHTEGRAPVDTPPAPAAAPISSVISTASGTATALERLRIVFPWLFSGLPQQ